MSMTEKQQERLDALLRNESDMAFARRARKLFGYLELQDEERFLDCGCGMGFYLLVAKKLAEVNAVGIDDDPVRVVQASQYAEVVKGSILSLPFEDSSFDKLVLSEVLEHVEEPLKLLRELHRVCEAGCDACDFCSTCGLSVLVGSDQCDMDCVRRATDPRFVACGDMVESCQIVSS